ncbi:MAG: FHA domain-containing protein [Actinomycetota bacterium]|nr:FHA domain-containing protein [Actinomycetota bacterium]
MGTGPGVVGRDPACFDLVIDEKAVSRCHAELRWAPEGYVVRDLESTNGVSSNGIRASSVLLRPGDELRLGQVRVRLSRRR